MKKKEEEFSVGGAQSSTSVLRPVKGSSDLTDQILRAARANPDANKPHSQIDCPITIYKNGFQVGNGEFRPLTDPKNVAFLEQLKDGDVPEEMDAEIQSQVGSNVSHVGISLVNKQAENFIPKFDFRQSSGNAVGNSSSSQSGVSTVTAKECKVDEKQPTTVVQIVLHPRERVKVTFNQTHTVEDLFQHIAFLSKVTKFTVLANFPPQPLTSMSATLKEANLLNSSVQQKLP